MRRCQAKSLTTLNTGQLFPHGLGDKTCEAEPEPINIYTKMHVTHVYTANVALTLIARLLSSLFYL